MQVCGVPAQARVLGAACRMIYAAATAALLSGRYKPQPGERVGIVVSGGNTVAVDFSR